MLIYYFLRWLFVCSVQSLSSVLRSAPSSMQHKAGTIPTSRSLDSLKKNSTRNCFNFYDYHIIYCVASNLLIVVQWDLALAKSLLKAISALVSSTVHANTAINVQCCCTAANAFALTDVLSLCWISHQYATEVNWKW